jgi:hypothetical protein
MLQPWFVLEFILSILSALRVFSRSRGDTTLEVLALRQQVTCRRLWPWRRRRTDNKKSIFPPSDIGKAEGHTTIS